MAEGGPPNYQTQKDDIKNCLNQPLKKGDIWYLLDTKWYKQWKKYVGFDSWDGSNVGEETANPGPIDNMPLLKADGNLTDHLSEDLDYILVPLEAWNKLLSWYGITPGQTSISRAVIEDGCYTKQLKIEVYLWNCKLCQYSQLEKEIPTLLSRSTTLEQLEKRMREVFSMSEEKDVRLWNRYMSNTYEHLSKMENTLQDSGLYPGQVIVIEQKNDDGTWPRQTKSASSYNSSSTSYERTATRAYSSNNDGGVSHGSTSSYNSYQYDAGRGSATPGLCGLSNLGNTCFMNSALQCMSNVPLLTEYFLSSKWKQELNPNNPLGMRGEIAESYAELVQTMWCGKHLYTLPRAFKLSVGRFAPQFSGYQQQDSQELMAFLLDGLHEDLNRIKSKPYVELTDADDRPDEVVSKEAWDNYLKRNDSVIIDTFHGLLKSTVQCPQCFKISVTFDPFCYLSLPLPIKKERQMTITWVPLSPEEKPQLIKLTVPKSGGVADLRKALSKIVDTPHEMMTVTDVYSHRFHKIFKEEEGLNHILERDIIYVYEVSVKNSDDPNVVILPIYFREKGRAKATSNYGGKDQLFGIPMLLSVQGKVTYDMLYDLLLVQMRRYITLPDPKEEWWKDEDKEDMEENGDIEDKDKDIHLNGEVNNMDVCDSDDELQDKKKDKKDSKVVKPKRLFTFTAVNSYGSTELEQKFIDDGHPLKITARSYIAVDWHSAAKEKFYNESEAESVEEHESGKNKNPQKKQVIQLTDCLSLFTEAEKLSEHDPWYCPSCKKHQQATKKFDLWTLPNILIIHLKRFSYNRYWRDKIDAHVEFPIQDLNLQKYVINNKCGKACYNLIGVSNHYGGLGGGHYTAYGLNKTTNEWYYFDDSSVSSSSEDQVVSKAAYVLVYQKCGLQTTLPQYISKPSTASSTATSGASDCNILNGAASGLSNNDANNTNGVMDNEDMDTN